MSLPDPGAESLKRLFEELRDASLSKNKARVYEILFGLEETDPADEGVYYFLAGVKKSMLKMMSETLKHASPHGNNSEEAIYVQGYTVQELLVPLEDTDSARDFVELVKRVNAVRLLRSDLLYYEAWFLPINQKREPFPVHLIYWNGTSWKAHWHNWRIPVTPTWRNPFAWFVWKVFGFVALPGRCSTGPHVIGKYK